ncbi:hypothetical protein ASPZODRAFT_130253 [Penicilliopsis zonata CBS 506.65]|uniref:Fungal STAND N-terminal Goodbye domain-containing protein n=1 Tax=Penicilliopsis zonata CBS 506.65 TaxID=1073090 RepID=A0A1L9SMF9_9EURO|nr:hypothetical protein ASPZODRAFT_130253 [Penicilliopsis zonata CBS 506.65]OJJ48281.1 hypothetical protein ASPZODRAFT_130253 [Penicilliopsis zonata CBS 506.65]
MKRTRENRDDEKKQIVTAFVRERASEYHDAFGVSTPLSGAGGDENRLPAARDLQAVLEAYNATVDHDRRFDIEQCTWDDVLDTLNEAEEEYYQKGKGNLNFVRRGFRIAGDYSDAIRPWVDLIPLGNGMEVLNAGLSVIFNIAKQNADNRGKILAAFHDIPAIILRTEEQQNQFARAAVLREKAIALYSTVVQALADLIFLLQGSRSGSSFKNHVKRMSKRCFAPSYTANQIDQILQRVRKSTEDFKECREMVKSQLAIETYQNTSALRVQATLIDSRTERMSGDVSHLAQGVDELNSSSKYTNVQLDGVQDQLSKLIMEVEASRAQQYAAYQPGMDAQAALCHFILNDFPGLWNAVASMNTPMIQSQSFLSRMDLLSCLGVSPRASVDDVDVVLKQHSVLTAEAQAQSQQLLSSIEFSRWMKASHAETLFVQGNSSIIGPCRVSPLSALCATLSLNLSKYPNCTVLHFFCGIHEAPGDPIAGPNGLIRSLIVQLLLTRATFNLDFINTRAFEELIRAHSLFDLCHTFRELIEQLPPTATVVCIMDGVARFESDAWLTDLLEVIHTLNQIIVNPALHPVVKLLVTTPFAQSGRVGRAIIAHHRLTLRNAVGGGMGHTISDRSLSSRMNRLDEYRLKMQQNGHGGRSEDDDSEEDQF